MADKIDEAKEKAKIIAEEGAEKAKKATKLAAEKLDEYYNKLPLDKINEKLGGKVNVKSRKVKIIVLAIVLFLALCVISCLFSSSDPIIPRSRVERYAACLSMSKDMFAQYGGVLLVNKSKNKPIAEKFNEETYGEYIERCKKTYNKEDIEKFKKFVEQAKKNYNNERVALQKSYDLAVAQAKRQEYIEKNAPTVINKSLDETFDTCKKVKMDEIPNGQVTAERIYEVWGGVATLHNSITGKTKEREILVTYVEDLTAGKIELQTTLTENRP